MIALFLKAVHKVLQIFVWPIEAVARRCYEQVLSIEVNPLRSKIGLKIAPARWAHFWNGGCVTWLLLMKASLIYGVLSAWLLLTSSLNSTPRSDWKCGVWLRIFKLIFGFSAPHFGRDFASEFRAP